MSDIYTCDPGGNRSYKHRVVDVQLFLIGPSHLRESVQVVLERHPLKCLQFRDERISSLSSFSLFHSLCLPPPPSLLSLMSFEFQPTLPQTDSGVSSFSSPPPPCLPLPSLLLPERFSSLLSDTSYQFGSGDVRDSTPDLSPRRVPMPHQRLRTPYIPLPGDTTPELIESP